MSRPTIVAGNWKMNTNMEEGVALAQALVNRTTPGGAVVVLGVPYTHLHAVANVIEGASHIHLAAQNCHDQAKGAYTGEISTSMLKSVGVEYVIIGHSERRQYFNESNEFLARKVDTVLADGLTPIFCCGEPLEIREAETHIAYVANQLKESLFHLSNEDFSKIVIAYEPIWAIGTGLTASPQQAQEMQQALRAQLADQFGADLSEACPILYGGSVKPGNAVELFGQQDVDGGLVGGASLKADDFVAIIEAGS